MCENGIVYEALMVNGAPLDRDYFRFDQLDTSLGIGYRQVHFKTPQKIDIKEFDVVIKGIIDEDRDIGQIKVTGVLKIKFRVISSEKFTETEYPSLYLTV